MILTLLLVLSTGLGSAQAFAQSGMSRRNPKASKRPPEAVEQTERAKPATSKPVATRVPGPTLSSRDLALRKLGVVPFALKGFTADQGDRLLKQFVNDLTAMSYFEATVVAGPTIKAERSQLSKNLNGAGVDGAIIAEVSPDRIAGQILSRSGETLKSFAIERASALGTDAQIKETSRAIVEEVASNIPYRGFITRRLSDRIYEINLGKSQGILVGQRYRVFEFASASLSAERLDRGEIKIIEVGDTTSKVEPTGADVRVFSKIGYNEQAHGMSMPEQVETRGYATIGAGLINISGTGDPKFVDRAYNVSSTPAFALGGRWKKFEVDLLFAQAQGDTSDLVYNEIIADYQLVDQPFQGLNRFSVWAGGRFARVSITTRRDIVTPLQSTNSISPEFSARLDRIIKGPVKGFVAASAYFPIFVSGMDTSAFLFSYGIGGDAGLSLDFSQRIFLDVGARYHLIRRPVEGQTSLNETYTEIFSQLGYRF